MRPKCITLWVVTTIFALIATSWVIEWIEAKPKVSLAAVFGLNVSLQVGDLYGFPLNYDPSTLCGQNLEVFIAVVSAADHFSERKAIRESWGSLPIEGVAILYFLGQSANGTVQKLIAEEQNGHNDVVTGEFVDHYDNLTLKIAFIVEWVTKKCAGRPKFLLKVDDDVYVNVAHLLAFSSAHRDAEKSMFGFIYSNPAPYRSPDESKYFVSTEEYVGDRYPDYLAGPAYILSGDLLSGLFNLLPIAPFFRIEDVLITGFLAQYMGVERIALPDISIYVYQWALEDLCALKTKIIAWHSLKPSEIIEIWESLQGLNEMDCEIA